MWAPGAGLLRRAAILLLTVGSGEKSRVPLTSREVSLLAEGPGLGQHSPQEAVVLLWSQTQFLRAISFITVQSVLEGSR